MQSRGTLAPLAVVLALLTAVVPSAAFGTAPVPAVAHARALQTLPVPKVAEQVGGIVLVRFKDASAAAVGRTLGARGASASALTAEPKHGFAALKVPKGLTAATFAARLSRDPNVAAAAPDYKKYVLGYVAPNDPAYNDSTGWSSGYGTSASYGKSWWLRGGGVNATAAWQHGYSDPASDTFPVRTAASAFKVAVIDTGFYMTHPDKGPNIVAGIDEFASRTPAGTLATDTDVTPPVADSSVASDPTEAIFDVSHGTCTAGEVAAATDNGVGVASVGYDAEAVMYKIMGKDLDPGSPGYGQTYLDDQAAVNAIYHATDAGCRVISMSFGGPLGPDEVFFQEAIDYAWAHGVAVLAATGNDGTGTVLYPAADNNVVGVGSYGYNGSRFRSSFSNYGTGLDILGPGDLVWGLIQPGYQSQSDPSAPPGYDFWAGTSMATPAAAGALAHMWRYQPNFTNAQIIGYIETHSAALRPQDVAGGGSGYLDMSLVMNGLMADYPYLTAPAVSAPTTVPGTSADLSWASVEGSSVAYAVSVDGSVVQTTTGTSATVSLGQGLHTLGVQATSPYNWYDSSSMATATIFAGTIVGATPPDGWGNFAPTGWATTQTPHVTVQACDATMGLSPGTAQYSYSTDGGSTWSGWSAASLTFAGAPTATQTISADVPFAHDSQTDDQVQFRVANAASLVGTSPVFSVKVDSTPPAGDFTIAEGAPTVATRTVSIDSTVTDAYPLQMRFSVDNGLTWSTWTAYAPHTTVTLPAGRTRKTVIGQYRNTAGGLVLQRTHTVMLATPFLVTRIAGYNRDDTAILTSRAHFATGTADTVIVATDANFADALSASALAGSYSAPLLLTPTTSLFREIPAEIARLHATRALIVGGEPAVSATVFGQLDALPGVSVRRISGLDRYATSAAIGTEVKTHEASLGHAFANKAFVARGDTFPDALAASPLAFEKRIPILLVKPTSIPAVIWTEIGTLMPNASTANIIVCGSTGAVGSGVTSQLTGAGRKWVRVGSPPSGTRYDTAAALAAYGVGQGWATWRFVGVATGQNFPDALGGGVAAGKMGGLVLLTQTASASPACVNALWPQVPFVDELDVFGGTAAVSTAAYNAIDGLF